MDSSTLDLSTLVLSSFAAHAPPVTSTTDTHKTPAVASDARTRNFQPWGPWVLKQGARARAWAWAWSCPGHVLAMSWPSRCGQHSTSQCQVGTHVGDIRDSESRLAPKRSLSHCRETIILFFFFFLILIPSTALSSFSSPRRAGPMFF